MPKVSWSTRATGATQFVVQDALDNAVNAGYMDSERMADADHAEYNANNWHDSFIYAGNANEPFWSEYLWIKPANERKK